MASPIPEKDVRRLFEGILRGEGDVFSRMASSHEGAGNCYPFPINGFVQLFNIMLSAGVKFSEQEIQDEVNQAIIEVQKDLELV